MNIELLVPVVIDCWVGTLGIVLDHKVPCISCILLQNLDDLHFTFQVDNMVLQYDNQTRKTSNADGVEIRVSGFGNSSVVEWIDPSKASPGAYFKDIAAELVKVGYVRDVSIRGAPYDFRKGPSKLIYFYKDNCSKITHVYNNFIDENEEFFQNLKVLVEETYRNNNNKSVVFITHSMGGLMTLVFLQKASQEWKNKYVRALISLAGPWGGSVKALKVYAVGKCCKGKIY